VTNDVLSLDDATEQMTAPGAMFEMTTVEIGDIEYRVWKNSPTSLRVILDLSLGHAVKDFIVYEDARYTFEQHYRIVATLAQRFVESGVKKGDRIAIASRNLPEWIFTFWAAVVVGAICVPLNAWWTTDELLYGLADSGASVALVDEERYQRIRNDLRELPELRRLIVVSEHAGKAPEISPDETVSVVSFYDFLGEVSPDAVPPEVEIAPEDPATMFYTSGTTGRPKGAVGTHRNSVTNLMNLFFLGQRANLRFGANEPTSDIQNGFLLNIPLFHATGCLAVMSVNTAAGGKIVMTHHFDPEQALQIIQDERITNIGGVPTIVMQMIDHPRFGDFDVSSVRSVSYGGAPSPPELVKRIRAAFPVGQPGNGYGLTETTAAVALISGPDYDLKPTSCGPAVPVVDVVIVPEDYEGDEPASDLPAGPDVVGELWIKGPNVVQGYWNKPEETKKSFTRGWLKSGDVGRIDEDGYIHIVDRAKDMIIRGGENVYSVEVEGALFEHPDVADCAVIGLPEETLGEEVAAVVVLRPGRVVEAEELMRHVGARLAKFSVPTVIHFRSSPLPRNPQGKVLKRQLREELLAAR